MRAIAIVWSYGRASLNELVAMWLRQTVAVPLFVWLDGAESITSLEAPAGVHVVAAQKIVGPRGSLAPMRRASLEHARSAFELGPRDAFIVLEDDDFYAPDHAQRALEVLSAGAKWTGSLRIGLQLAPGALPELVEGESGPGQHAAWAMRLEAYDAAGGYPDVQQDDVALGFAIGWRNCTPHRHLTHVRRRHATNLSGLEYDGELARRRATLTADLAPRWTAELDFLTAWTRCHA